jgi:hypothetical protein
VIFAIAAPAAIGVINSTRMTQAGEEVVGLLSQAQQIAVSESRPVEVRFYRMGPRGSEAEATAEAPQYSAVMIVKYYQQGEPDPTSPEAVPLGQPLAVAEFGGLFRLPSGVVMSPVPRLSSFMTLPERQHESTSGGAARLVTRTGGRYENMNMPPTAGYRSFLILPEGTDLNASQQWFVTMINQADLTAGPESLNNFYTVQIEPVTGRLMTYRP